MSIVRFSSNGFRSDVYAYEDVSGGITVHVTSARYDMSSFALENPFKNKSFDEVTSDEVLQFHRSLFAYVDQAEINPINGPYDGATRNYETYEDFERFLIELRSTGYNIPEEVFVVVEEEINERDG